MSTPAERQKYSIHFEDVYKLPSEKCDYVVNEYWLARGRLGKEPRTEIDKYLLSVLREAGIPEGSIYFAHSLLSAGFLGEEVQTLPQLQAEAKNESMLNDSDNRPSMLGDRKREKNGS